MGLERELWTLHVATPDRVEPLGQGELPTASPPAASDLRVDDAITRATAAPPNVLVLKASALLHAPKPSEQ